MPSPEPSTATSLRQASSPPADAPIAMIGILGATISGRGFSFGGFSFARGERSGPVLARRTGLEGISVDLRSIGSRPNTTTNITSAPGRYLYNARLGSRGLPGRRYIPSLPENRFDALRFVSHQARWRKLAIRPPCDCPSPGAFPLNLGP